MQKRGLAHTIEGGLFPEERIASALALDSPPPNNAKLPADVKQAISFVSSSSAEGVRSFWENARKKLKERGAEPEGERRGELLRVDPQCRPFVSKIHPPLFRETMLEVGTGALECVDQFLAGFPTTGSAPEEGAYSTKGDSPPPVSRSEILEGAPERCRARLSSRLPPFDSRLWKEALPQKEKGWLEGPSAISRDAIPDKDGIKIG